MSLKLGIIPTSLYILDRKGEPIRPTSWQQAGRFNNNRLARIVRKEWLDINGTEIQVSTVFLMTDHNFGRSGGPVLWETMIFGGPNDQYQERCAGSRKDALEMHYEVLNKVRKGEL